MNLPARGTRHHPYEPVAHKKRPCCWYYISYSGHPFFTEPCVARIALPSHTLRTAISYSGSFVGLWETVALCLICAASACLARSPASSHYGLVSFVKFIHRPGAYMRKQELTLILVGIVLLMLSALMETLNIHLF